MKEKMKKITDKGRAKKKSTPRDIEIKELVKKIYRIMVEEDLNEIALEEDNNFKIKLRRQGSALPLETVISASGTTKDTEETKEADTAHYIRSPMNGVFYRAASPGAEPCVKENDEVAVGRTICIIEAMKLMNEVQIERHCKILKILVENGSPVKVSQPLFEVENL